VRQYDAPGFFKTTTDRGNSIQVQRSITGTETRNGRALRCLSKACHPHRCLTCHPSMPVSEKRIQQRRQRLGRSRLSQQSWFPSQDTLLNRCLHESVNTKETVASSNRKVSPVGLRSFFTPAFGLNVSKTDRSIPNSGSSKLPVEVNLCEASWIFAIRSALISPRLATPRVLLPEPLLNGRHLGRGCLFSRQIHPCGDRGTQSGTRSRWRFENTHGTFSGNFLHSLVSYVPSAGSGRPAGRSESGTPAVDSSYTRRDHRT